MSKKYNVAYKVSFTVQESVESDSYDNAVKSLDNAFSDFTVDDVVDNLNEKCLKLKLFDLEELKIKFLSEDLSLKKFYKMLSNLSKVVRRV